MRTLIQTIRGLRWRWALAGCLVSIGSFFFVPFNFAFLGAFDFWKLWLMFPYGMLFRGRNLPEILDGMAWFGPPILYGLILSAVSGTRWWRLSCYTLIILHIMAAYCAALM
jgi:hypothetical protein